jgi:putative membrane protein
MGGVVRDGTGAAAGCCTGIFSAQEPVMKELFAVASVCALLISVPAWAQTAGTRSPEPPTAAQPVASGASVLSEQDQTFVKEAGAGNLAEANLGKLAERKAATPAVREFGRWMYTDHDLVANNWLKTIMATQAQPFEPTLTAEQQQIQRKLEGVSGNQFDREYIQNQVADHEKTIPVFEKEAGAGQNPMIKSFAENMIPVLRQHLAEARALAGAPRVATGRATTTSESSGSSMPR